MQPFASLSAQPGPSSQTVFWIRPSDSCPPFPASLSLDTTHQQGLENGFAVGPEQKARLCYFVQQWHSLHPFLSMPNECIEGGCKSQWAPQTKEIKFGNLAVTGVLWLYSDHTGGNFCWLTHRAVCSPFSLEFCGDKDEIGFVLFDCFRACQSSLKHVWPSGPEWAFQITNSSFILPHSLWFAKFSPKGPCRYL